jgi:hypothetical protein
MVFGSDSGAWITWVGKSHSGRAVTSLSTHRNGNTTYGPRSILRYSQASTMSRTWSPISCSSVH